jgi:V8-like Glu-specific endopeptidase
MIRTFRPLWLPLLGAALLTACDTAAPGALDDAMRLGDARLGPLAEQGHISVTLGDGKDDPTVIEDARSILVGALDNMAALDFAAGHHVSVTYLGKGKVAPRGAEVDEGPAPEGAAAREPGAHVEGIDAINLATKNEFRIVFGGGLLAAVGERDARLGLDRGTPADQEPMPRPIVPEGVVFTITSNGDDRTRTYGVNADVTNAVHRRLVQLGSGCSGTLVGPRHVVTAGHCLWSRTNRTWSDDFWVRAGANGTAEDAQVLVNNDNIPNGQVLWYYTPAQFRSTDGSSTWGFDYGILTIPGRLGDTVGWMGRVAYSSSSLADAYVYRRGYPACSATSNGQPRIDVPSPCSANHQYGNTNDCSVGEYESLDGDGWNRVVHHSCDASGGDSGSPLYVYHEGSPAVAAVHFFSECNKTNTDVACTGSWVTRPLGAIRMTPEYRDLIGTFRGLYP